MAMLEKQVSYNETNHIKSNIKASFSHWLDRQLEFVTNLGSQMAWMLANLTLMGSLLAVILYNSKDREKWLLIK